jgi:hypothetical protein
MQQGVVFRHNFPYAVAASAYPMAVHILSQSLEVPMFTLIRTVPLAQVLSRQLPAFAISLILAELFYKFHSFSLECLAFLGTWYIIDFIFQSVADRGQRK